MWDLYSLGGQFGYRPSAVIELDDEWAAYQFDLAVLQFGRAVEARVSKGERVEDLLAPDPSAAVAGSAPRAEPGFRSLQGRVTGKVRSIKDWMEGREKPR